MPADSHLTTGMRFTFTQELFDLICTDLSSFSVARAVTASSAVPVAFPTVVLKNHADQCDVSKTDAWRFLEEAQPGSRSQDALIEKTSKKPSASATMSAYTPRLRWVAITRKRLTTCGRISNVSMKSPLKKATR